MILGRMRKKPCKQIGRKFHAVKPPSRIKQKLVRESSRLPLDYNFCFFFFFFFIRTEKRKNFLVP